MRKIPSIERFDQQDYDQLFQCFLRYGSTGSSTGSTNSSSLIQSTSHQHQYEQIIAYESTLQREFEAAIESCVDTIVCGKYGLSYNPSYLPYILLEIYSEYAKILYNHHLILRFHMSPTDPGAPSPILSNEAKTHISQSLLKTQRPDLVQYMQKMLIEKVF